MGKRYPTEPFPHIGCPNCKMEEDSPYMKILLQIALVFGVCLVGEGIGLLLPIPFPASVISMVLLFVLLVCRVIKPDHIREKARFLSANMAFFFIPAGVGIMDQYPVIREHLLVLLLICLVTTVLTFGATALTVKGVLYIQHHLSPPGNGQSASDADAASSLILDGGEHMGVSAERNARETSMASREREQEGAV